MREETPGEREVGTEESRVKRDGLWRRGEKEGCFRFYPYQGVYGSLHINPE